MELKTVEIENPDNLNMILGQSHFIKTVEDIYETMVTTVSAAKFGVAFCEASDVLDVTEVHCVLPSERERPPISDVVGVSETAWIFPREFPGLDEEAAIKEAERCLQCGLICYKKVA